MDIQRLASNAARLNEETRSVYVTASKTDSDVKNFCLRQLTKQNPTVNIFDNDLGEPFEKPWFIRTKEYIRRSEYVVCLVGEDTWLQSSVEWELTLALSMKKNIVAMQIDKTKLIVPPFPLIDQSIQIHNYDLHTASELLSFSLA